MSATVEEAPALRAKLNDLCERVAVLRKYSDDERKWLDLLLADADRHTANITEAGKRLRALSAELSTIADAYVKANHLEEK